MTMKMTKGAVSMRTITPKKTGIAVAAVMALAAAAAMAFAAAAAMALLATPALAISGKSVVLQGLDKVTARVQTIEAEIGQTVTFGALEITVRACDRTPPTEPPESVVFLDIFEAKPGQKRADLFHGWMFASSPALNALEHPVYDVWVLECKIPK